ncbi:hypothetical protein ACFYU5_34900 [Nocardia aobensis]|uniref:Uncharacterized protein n=1 Tax=Nocardia aobensis TaxID=257277 RepID=A0ABW6PEL2_9NOCA
MNPNDEAMNRATDKLWIALAVATSQLPDAERDQIRAQGGVHWVPDPDNGDMLDFQINGRTFLLASRQMLIDPEISVDDCLASLVYVEPTPDSPADLEP